MTGDNVSIGDIVLYTDFCGSGTRIGHIIDFIGCHYEVRRLDAENFMMIDNVYPRNIVTIVSAVYNGRKRI